MRFEQQISAFLTLRGCRRPGAFVVRFRPLVFASEQAPRRRRSRPRPQQAPPASLDPSFR